MKLLRELLQEMKKEQPFAEMHVRTERMLKSMGEDPKKVEAETKAKKDKKKAKRKTEKKKSTSVFHPSTAGWY